MKPPSLEAAAVGSARPIEPPRWGRLVWLAYLLIYPTPWFGKPPSRLDVIASLLGVGVFLAIYLKTVFAKPRNVAPYVVALALIGFALAPFGGIWFVFNIYASSLAGLLGSRRKVVVALGILQASLVGFGLLIGQTWFAWIWGVFFGLMAGFGAAWQFEVETKNRELEAAQSEVRTMAASAERERIARDLHDLLGHTLTLVAIKADLAARLVDRDASAARREMEEVAEAARGALGEVRAAVTGMRGATLETEIARARRMLAAAEVKAIVRVDAKPADSPDGEAVLAMALREAVTNVIRHARASCCTIAVAQTPWQGRDGALRLSVEDDGRGGPIQEGSGLSGMRARLAAAGGRLEVRSDGGGTRLTASLPMTGGAKAGLLAAGA